MRPATLRLRHPGNKTSSLSANAVVGGDAEPSSLTLTQGVEMNRIDRAGARGEHASLRAGPCGGSLPDPTGQRNAPADALIDAIGDVVQISHSPLEIGRAHLLCAFEQTSAEALSADDRFALACRRARVLEGLR